MPIGHKFDCPALVAYPFQFLINTSIGFVIFLPQFVSKKAPEFGNAVLGFRLIDHLAKVGTKPNLNAWVGPGDTNAMLFCIRDNLIKVNHSVPIKYNPWDAMLRLQGASIDAPVQQFSGWNGFNVNFNVFFGISR